MFSHRLQQAELQRQRSWRLHMAELRRQEGPIMHQPDTWNFVQRCHDMDSTKGFIFEVDPPCYLDNFYSHDFFDIFCRLLRLLQQYVLKIRKLEDEISV